MLKTILFTMILALCSTTALAGNGIKMEGFSLTEEELVNAAKQLNLDVEFLRSEILRQLTPEAIEKANRVAEEHRMRNTSDKQPEFIIHNGKKMPVFGSEISPQDVVDTFAKHQGDRGKAIAELRKLSAERLKKLHQGGNK